MHDRMTILICELIGADSHRPQPSARAAPPPVSDDAPAPHKQATQPGASSNPSSETQEIT